MYLLLPQVVGRDQQGVAAAVDEHFATAHAWEAVLRARVSEQAVRHYASCRFGCRCQPSELLLNQACYAREACKPILPPPPCPAD